RGSHRLDHISGKDRVIVSVKCDVVAILLIGSEESRLTLPCGKQLSLSFRLFQAKSLEKFSILIQKKCARMFAFVDNIRMCSSSDHHRAGGKLDDLTRATI